MIKNERQYRVAKEHARRFAASVRAIEEGGADSLAADPLIVKAQKEALASQLADLENELREYDDMKRMIRALDKLDAEYVPPPALADARMALGITAKDLAERVGLEEREIRVYEETNYASASVSRVSEIASALRACRDETDSAVPERPRA